MKELLPTLAVVIGFSILGIIPVCFLVWLLNSFAEIIGFLLIYGIGFTVGALATVVGLMLWPVPPPPEETEK